MRVTQPLNDKFTVGFQLLNGWNNVQDNNSGKTVGVTTALTTSKVSWFNNYYTGPEKSGTNEGKRNFFDTVVLLTPSEKANFYVNFDYGTETIDAPYEPFQLQMDARMRAAGYRPDVDWMTRKFDGADHSERAWRARADIPLRFLLA